MKKNTNNTTTPLQPDFILDDTRPSEFIVTDVNKGTMNGQSYSWISDAKGWFINSPAIIKKTTLGLQVIVRIRQTEPKGAASPLNI